MIAVAGAQAADMPVKAKPAEYVKICTLYGAGFYYIPGTDTCIKIGGYVRFQTDLHGGGGGIVDGSFPQANQARFTRDLTNDINYRVRGVVTFDARTQTDYGTLRSYFRAGWGEHHSGGDGRRHHGHFVLGSRLHPVRRLHGRSRAVVLRRLHLRWRLLVPERPRRWRHRCDRSEPLGLHGSVRQRRVLLGVAGRPRHPQGGSGRHHLRQLHRQRAPLGDDAHTVNGDPCAAPAEFGFRVPDIITNLRVDQAWGYVGVSTAIHEASGASTMVRRTTSITVTRPTSMAGRCRPSAC